MVQSIAGCDSIITLDLTINNYNASDVKIVVQICSGDSIYLGGLSTIKWSIYDTLQTIYGCDSIISTTLVVDTLLFSTDTLTICNEDSVLFGGSYYNSGVYYTLQAIAGCDSVRTCLKC